MIKKQFLLLYLCSFYFSPSFAQNIDSTQTPAFFSGVITATNNGISLLPNFSLNKPAVLFDLSVGKGRLSFDPMFRFAMDGKPWTLVFWWHYKLFTGDHFKMSLGAHPSFLFRTESFQVNGVNTEYTTAQRFLGWEATPTWFISKKVGIGLYYLGSHGLSETATRFTHFIAFRTLLSNIALSDRLNFTFIPQVYYLKLDKLDGTYVNATLLLKKKNFPLALSSIVSRSIDTDIPGKDFIWNIGLNYNFENFYYKRAKP